MLHDIIDATLEELTAEDLVRLEWSVDVWERAGQMTATEALEWRQRIREWQQFRDGKLDRAPNRVHGAPTAPRRRPREPRPWPRAHR